MATTQREQIYEKTVKRLVEEHKKLKDEPLELAVRLKAARATDIEILEVIGRFPGESTDPPFQSEFPPSAMVRVLGTLILQLCSPAQFENAIKSPKFQKRVADGDLVFQSSLGKKLWKKVAKR
jgi:hypothetical protein